MKIRRIVTGNGNGGKSEFVSDGPAPRAKDFDSIRGFSSALVWSTPAGPTLGRAAQEDPTPSLSSFVPEVGGTRLLVVTFPPDSVMRSPGFDPVAAGMESLRESPGLAETFELDHPGMHTTDTVDYGVVLEGEICLELDDGEERVVRQREIVVQNGTRHAWRNRGTLPAILLFVLIGAHRTTSR